MLAELGNISICDDNLFISCYVTKLKMFRISFISETFCLSFIANIFAFPNDKSCNHVQHICSNDNGNDLASLDFISFLSEYVSHIFKSFKF